MDPTLHLKLVANLKVIRMAEEVEIVRDTNNTFLEKKAHLRALQLDLCNKPGDPAKQV